jgi:hypothetical protein
VQSALQGISGMRTVPQVFVGGKLVGGCDGGLCGCWLGRGRSAEPAMCCLGRLSAPGCRAHPTRGLFGQAAAAGRCGGSMNHPCPPIVRPAADTVAAYQSGKLKELLAASGISI